MTDRAWFRRHLRHPARKWSRSILTTPEPARHQDTDHLLLPNVEHKTAPLLPILVGASEPLNKRLNVLVTNGHRKTRML